MKRSKLNFIIDIVAFIAFLLLTTTGVLLRYILPPGSGKHSTIWNLDRHEWGGIHFWISVTFFSILALHLFLHWRWILSLVKGRPRKKEGKRSILGVLGLIVVVFIAITPLLTPVEIDSNKKENHETNVGDIEIKGSMTLNEVQSRTKVPIDYIIKKMGLPESISVNEKLNSLKSEYGFEMSEVRKVIADYDD
ncbi:MAG: DUF4405 domain-containing protein [Flavobacteriaceae bacterium]|nr:DUF4405 domain-containing protein [Flavobacteriaceae bacterium]